MTRDRRAVILFLVFLVLVGLLYWSSTHHGTEPESKTIVLRKSSNNMTIKVRADQDVRIELESKPSTGMRWQLVSGKVTTLPETEWDYNKGGETGNDGRLQPFAVQYAALPTTVKVELLRPDQSPEETFTVTLVRAN